MAILRKKDEEGIANAFEVWSIRFLVNNLESWLGRIDLLYADAEGSFSSDGSRMDLVEEKDLSISLRQIFPCGVCNLDSASFEDGYLTHIPIGCMSGNRIVRDWSRKERHVVRREKVGEKGWICKRKSKNVMGRTLASSKMNFAAGCARLNQRWWRDEVKEDSPRFSFTFFLSLFREKGALFLPICGEEE